MKWLTLLLQNILIFLFSTNVCYAQSIASSHFNPVYWQEQKLVLDLPVDAIIEKSTANNIQIKGETWMCSFSATYEPTIKDGLTKDELLQGAADYFYSIGIKDIESIESVTFTSADGFQLETNNPDPKKIHYFIHTSNKIRLTAYCITEKNKEKSTEAVSFDIYQY